MHGHSLILTGIGLLLAGVAAPQFEVTELGSLPAFAITETQQPAAIVPIETAPAPIAETQPVVQLADCPGGRCLLPALPRRSVERHVEKHVVQQPAAAPAVASPSCAGGAGTNLVTERRAPLRSGARAVGHRIFRGRCR